MCIKDGYSDQLVTFRGAVGDAEDAPASLLAWWEDGATRLDAIETVPTASGQVLGLALIHISEPTRPY